jgi:hypothetical protein
MLGYKVKWLLLPIKEGRVFKKAKKSVARTELDELQLERSHVKSTVVEDRSQSTTETLVEWTGADLLKPYGFYPMASDESAIWSGPGLEAGFHVDLPGGSAYRFMLAFNPRIDRPDGVGLCVKIDNRYIDFTETNDGSQLIWGIILLRQLSGLRKISFVVDSTLIPVRFNSQIADVRQIGISLHTVRIWTADS